MSDPLPPLPDFDTEWDHNNPAATEARFRSILADTDATLHPSYHAQLLTQIARCQGLQRDFDQAHATLDDVEKRLPALSAAARVRYLLERGRAINSGGDPAGSLTFFQSAFELASGEHLDAHAVDAAHMIAIVLPEPDDQLKWNERTLSMAEASDEPRARKWRGSLLNNIGWTHHAAGRLDDALAAFTQALEVRVEQGDPANIHVARWCVGRGLRSVGRLDEAMALQRELEHDDPDVVGHLGYVHEEIAECLHALGKHADAAPHFRSAHEILSADAWLAEAEPERLARLLARSADGQQPG